jgi:hypothetical protein
MRTSSPGPGNATEKIAGLVERVTYFNEQSWFSVLPRECPRTSGPRIAKRHKPALVCFVPEVQTHSEIQKYTHI